MAGPIITVLDVHSFKARLPAMRYVRGDRQNVSNLWIFHSPKNDLRFAIQTDRDFGQFVLLEGNVDVLGYKPYPLQPVLELAKTKEDFAPSAQVFLRDGSSEWWCFRERSTAAKGHRRDGSPREVHSDGSIIRFFGREDFKGRELEFDNWLILCAAITRNASYSKHHEQAELLRLAQSKKAFRLKESLELKTVDPSLMLSSVAMLLQKGQLRAELKSSIFTLNSKISWV